MKNLYGFIKYIFPLLVILFFLYFKLQTGIVLLFLYFLYVILMKRASFYVLAGKINYANGDLKSAVQWFARAQSTGDLKIDSQVTYGYVMLKYGDIGRAENFFESLMKNKKLDEKSKMLVESNYALVLWKKGQVDEAIKLLETVYDNFKTTSIYGSLGFLLLLKGDLERALNFNLEAYEYNSTSPVIIDNLGQSYFLTGDYDKAEETYIKLFENNPTFPDAYYNYGLVLAKKGKYNEASEIMNKAFKYELSFLSTVTKEEIEEKINELSILIDNECNSDEMI
jgi:tetratricopeptide (TPR) repeat protein